MKKISSKVKNDSGVNDASSDVTKITKLLQENLANVDKTKKQKLRGRNEFSMNFFYFNILNYDRPLG